MSIFSSIPCECSGFESLTSSNPSMILVTARALHPYCLYFVHFQLIKFSLSFRLTVKENPSIRSFRPPRLVEIKLAGSKFVSRSMTKSSKNEIKKIISFDSKLLKYLFYIYFVCFATYVIVFRFIFYNLLLLVNPYLMLSVKNISNDSFVIFNSF